MFLILCTYQNSQNSKMFLISCTNQNSQNLKMFITMFKILLIKTSKTVKCKFTLYGSREISRDQKYIICTNNGMFL